MATSINNLSVLVVDSDLEWREFTCHTLAEFGIQAVVGCGESSEALEHLDHDKIDVIFIDSAIAPVDGLSLVKKIRSVDHNNRATPPIIFMTGRVSDDMLSDSRRAGANDFLVKPFTPIDLMGHLMSVIERPQPFIRTRTYFGPDRRLAPYNSNNGEDRRDGEARRTDGETTGEAADGLPPIYASKAR